MRSAGNDDRRSAQAIKRSVCSERRRVPVLRVEPTALDGLGERVERAVAAGHDRLEAAYAREVRAALSSDGADVEAQRRPSRVHVSVTLPWPADARQRSRVADRARAAVRSYDPFVPVIDVSVIDRPAGARPTGDEEWLVDDGDDLFLPVADHR